MRFFIFFDGTDSDGDPAGAVGRGVGPAGGKSGPGASARPRLNASAPRARTHMACIECVALASARTHAGSVDFP